MKIAKLNNLYFYFFCSQLIILSAYFYHTPLISDTIDTHTAIWMQMIGIFWSAVGYFTVYFAFSLRVEKIDDNHYNFKDVFYVWSYIFIVTGTTVSMLQVFLFVPPIEYISKMFSGSFDIAIRNAYLLSSEEGGLPGIIKMFAYAPLSIYLMSLGLLSFTTLNEADTHRLKVLSAVALAAIVIKVFFSLDNLTIMAVIVANIFIGLKKGYMKNIRYWMLIVFAFFLADYLSSKRIETFGMIDFTLLYFKLGLVNFQLMIETVSGFTYGFSTILMPFSYIFKFIGLSLPEFVTSYAWEWNPAQYFASYAFQDFGYFYFVLFYIVGILLCKIDNQVKNNVYISAIYFIVLYGVLSFVIVPAIRGIDFWFAILLPCLLLNRFATTLNIRPISNN